MENKPNRAQALAVIREVIKTAHRPVLIGPMAMLLGPFWGLKETEQLLIELVTQGEARYATKQECDQFDCTLGFVGVLEVSGA